MPNHVHGIIEIDNNNVETVPRKNRDFQHAISNVETQNLASLPNQLSPQLKNLCSIIRGFKIGVNKFANKNDISFKWQTRFYDRVIRDENELYNIQRYIIENPLKWELDRYYIN
jgi:REP element-mobilizing transposase RayT